MPLPDLKRLTRCFAFMTMMGGSRFNCLSYFEGHTWHLTSKTSMDLAAPGLPRVHLSRPGARVLLQGPHSCLRTAGPEPERCGQLGQTSKALTPELTADRSPQAGPWFCLERGSRWLKAVSAAHVHLMWSQDNVLHTGTLPI